MPREAEPRAEPLGDSGLLPGHPRAGHSAGQRKDTKERDGPKGELVINTALLVNEKCNPC